MSEKINLYGIFILLLLIFNGCISQYYPVTNEMEELLVVDGLITDQPGINTIKISKSRPLWKNQNVRPVKNCIVSITDDLGIISNLREISDGLYVTDSATFQGRVGRSYTLHIQTTADSINYTYSSTAMLMKAVPPIDSIYYEKRIFITYPNPYEGCEIYFNTQDLSNNCRFYKWDYSETWEFHLPFDVPNRICWKSDKSTGIFIRNTSVLSEDKTVHYNIKTIKNPIDRLTVKYSLIINQYSLNEDEFLYWERLKNTIDQVGGLYDQVPTLIPNNIFCNEDRGQAVLGYFSVSAKKSKRIFIKDKFKGFHMTYIDCVTDTIFGYGPIDGINYNVWLLVDRSYLEPPRRYITNKWACGDCRSKGTNIKPPFWDDDK